MQLDMMLLAMDDLAMAGAYARTIEEMGFAALWTAETQHNPFFTAGCCCDDNAPVTTGHGGCGGISAQPDSIGAHCLGPASQCTRSIYSGAWHPAACASCMKPVGVGSYRAPGPGGA